MQAHQDVARWHRSAGGGAWHPLLDYFKDKERIFHDSHQTTSVMVDISGHSDQRMQA